MIYGIGTDICKIKRFEKWINNPFFLSRLFNAEEIVESNGAGEILWDKTINETTAIIKNKKPYYVELQTINTRSNEFDYFKLLHERNNRSYAGINGINNAR